MSLEALAVITAALVIGTIGKAVTGFGLPLIAIPVMAPYLGVESAVIVMLIPATVTNAWLVWEHRRSAVEIDRLGLTMVVGLAGIFAGTWLLASLDERVMALVMAAWIGVYLASLAVRGGLRVKPQRAGWLTPAVVLFAGVFQGATGIAGPIVVTYLHALRLAPGAYVFLVAVIFTAYGIFHVISAIAFGMFTGERLMQGLISLIPVVALMPVGLKIGRIISRRIFDACVIVLLAVMALVLAWKGLTGTAMGG